MKTIDQDTIDFAEDFFFKLSPNQLSDKLDDLIARQGDIALLLSSVKQVMKTDLQLEISWTFGFMVDYCFKSTYGEIEWIQKQKILDRLEWEQQDILDHPSPNGSTDYQKEIFRIGQTLMLKSIEAKLELYIHESKIFP